MLEMYRTELETNVTEKTAKYEKGNWINMISPTEEEINDFSFASINSIIECVKKHLKNKSDVINK